MAEKNFCSKTYNEGELRTSKGIFGGFSGDHRTFVSWNKDFLQKEKKMKKEAQERLMGDVGGTGQYNGTPPSNYCPSVARFRFISENYLCEKCGNRFENEAEVMIHIRNVHFKDHGVVGHGKTHGCYVS